MREIKFRAIRKTDNKIFEVMSLDIAEEEIMSWDEEESNIIYIPFDKIELMQYAGLKDKNGVEIYEGNIVRKSSGAVGQVVYLKATAGYKLFNHGQVFDIFESDARYLEIIGNIYENQELLK